MARVVAVMLGLDKLPGTTVTRYCSSSLQTTRMAFHAIKAGEGDVFISAGVEMVSRFGKGNSDSWPDTKNAIFAEAGAADRRSGQRRRGLARPARGRQDPRRLHRDGPDRRERRPKLGHHPPGAGRVRRPLAEPGREGHGRRVLGARDHPRAAARRPDRLEPTTAPRPASTLREGLRAQARVPARRHGHRGQLLPAQRRRRRGRHHERHARPPSWASPRWPGSCPPASPACPRRSWGSARSRPPARRWAGPA